MKQMKNRAKEKGALSLEMLLALIIVLALLGWALSRGTMMQSRAGTITEGTNSVALIENVRGLLKSNGSYGAVGSDLVASLITAAGVPTDMTVQAGRIYNTYGGEVAIVSTGTGFSVTTPRLPPDICMQAAMKVSGAVPGVTTSINGGGAISGAVASSAAAAACNQAGNNNSIVYNAS